MVPLVSALIRCSQSELMLSALGWSAQAEISTPLLRAKSAGVGALVHGASKLLWYWTVPYMLSDQKVGWGAKTRLFFGGLTAIWFIPVYFFYPEVCRKRLIFSLGYHAYTMMQTKYRNFAALDDLFDRRIPERKFHLTESPYDSANFREDIRRRREKPHWWKRSG